MDNTSPSLLAKQECRASSPPSIMRGNQVHIRLSEHHSPPNQLLLVSSPSGEDSWHLPGRLRINPSLWDKEDVAHWLRWAHKEYSLRCPEKRRFEMNGRALCLLTKEDFRRRCPSAGDVLYEILQCVKQQRLSLLCDPPSTSPLTGNIQRTVSCRTSPHSVQERQPPTGNDHQVLNILEHREQIGKMVQKQTYSTTAISVEPHKQCPPQTESIIQEPLNLSSREKPSSPLHKANGRIPECRLLWDYVYQLLCDDRYQEYIRWEDQESLVFRVVDPNGLARLWGNHKNRDNMTYEKMSRALRHYYKLNIIKKERGQKLLFRFLKIPQDIRKQVADPAVSPEHTSQDRDSPDVSPAHDFSGDHFEVSPDRSSPQVPT